MHFEEAKVHNWSLKCTHYLQPLNH